MILAKPKLLGRGHHAVGRVAVGFARRDLEAAGQHRTGQGGDDLVAHREILGATHNAANLFARAAERSIRGLFARLGHAHLAPANRLAVALLFFNEFEHLAHHNRAGDIGAVDVFFFKAHLDQCRVNILGGGAGSKINVLGEPTQRNAHQTTMPNCCEKRTSPSTMSCMSCTPLRNISVRSTPMPNAKPE